MRKQLITLIIGFTLLVSSSSGVLVTDVHKTDTIIKNHNITEYTYYNTTTENGTLVTERNISGWHMENIHNEYLLDVGKVWLNEGKDIEVTATLKPNNLTRLIVANKEPWKSMDRIDYYNTWYDSDVSLNTLESRIGSLPVYKWNGSHYGIEKTVSIKDKPKNVTVKIKKTNDMKVKIGYDSIVLDIDNQSNWTNNFDLYNVTASGGSIALGDSNKIDSFEDGEFTSNPSWTDISSDAESTVTSGSAQDGTYKLVTKGSDQGGPGNHRNGGVSYSGTTINDGERYTVWINPRHDGTNDHYRLLVTLKTGSTRQIQLKTESGVHACTGPTWSYYNGATTCGASYSADSWYKAIITADTAADTFDITVEDSGGSTVQSWTGISAENGNAAVDTIELLTQTADGNANTNNWDTWYDLATYQPQGAAFGNATGHTQTCKAGDTCNLEWWQVGVNSLPSGGKVNGIFESMNSSNITIDKEVCTINNTGLQNLTCASDITDGFSNYRIIFNMSTTGKSPEVSSTKLSLTEFSEPTSDIVRKTGSDSSSKELTELQQFRRSLIPVIIIGIFVVLLFSMADDTGNLDTKSAGKIILGVIFIAGITASVNWLSGGVSGIESMMQLYSQQAFDEKLGELTIGEAGFILTIFAAVYYMFKRR